MPAKVEAGGDAHALSLGEGGADAVEVFESGGSGAAHQYKHLHLGVGDHGEGAVGGAVEAEWYGLVASRARALAASVRANMSRGTAGRSDTRRRPSASSVATQTVGT